VSDYPANAKQAAPPEQLEAHIMSASTPKGDAEWWAMGEIQRLRAELTEVRRDAERYRWLRSCVDAPALYAKNHPGKLRSLLAFQALDATIDIARGET
jgi:hypothetical protein